MAKELDLAYAAGIIDGEGSISIYKTHSPRAYRGYNYYMTVRVGMIDAAIPIWFRNTFGGSLRKYRKKTLNSLVVYVWVATTGMVCEFLRAILPHLKIKQEQAKVAIDFQELKQPRGSYSRGKPKPPTLFRAEARLAQVMTTLNHTHKEVQIGNIF